MNAKPQRYAIVGMQFREKEGIPATAILKDAPPDEPCILVRDPGNPHDPNAVQVWVRGQHVGFVPRSQNDVLSRFIASFGETVTELMKKNRQTPFMTIAMDSAGAADLALKKAVDGRLHKGNNKYPLIEIA